jgi:hypothetical protein
MPTAGFRFWMHGGVLYIISVLIVIGQADAVCRTTT